MRVEDTISAPDHHAGRERVSEAGAGREVVPIGMNQSPVEDVAVLGKDHGAGLRIEIGKLIVLLPRWSGIFIAYAEIYSQFGCDLEIILEEGEIHILALIHNS